MTLKALREKRANLVAKMRGVIDTAAKENRDLTAEEQTQFALDETEADGLKGKIERLEKLEATERELDAAIPAAGERATRPTNAPGAEAKREFSSLGEFIHAVRFNQNDQRLTGLYHEGSEPRGEMRTDDGSSGGFAIPVTFRDDLMSVDQTPAVVRPRATVIPAGSPPDGEVVIPALDQSAATNMYGGVQVAWIAEGATKPDTSAKIRQITLRPQEVAASIKVTDKLLRNWSAAGSLLSSLLRKAIAAAEDVAFIMGNGVGKPLGFLNSSAAIAVNRVTANQITYADVLTMEETLFGDGAEVVWVCSKRARTWLRQLKNPAGYYIWQEDAKQTGPATLLGHPVVVSDRTPTLGNRGDLMLLDMSDYLIKDGSGPFVAMSEHLNFLTNETVIKIFWNVDGQPWVKSPIKNEAGELQTPFVILN